MLEFKETRKGIYIIKVRMKSVDTEGHYQYTEIEDDMSISSWDKADELFFAYMACGRYDTPKFKETEFKDNHYGDHIKLGPLRDYLGEWENYIDIWYDDIDLVRIYKVDEDGAYTEVKLPDLTKEYKTEEEFIKAFKETVKELRSERQIDDGIAWLNPWELEEAKEVLKVGGWDQDELDHMYYINSDINFSCFKYERASFLANDLWAFVLEEMKNREGLKHTGLKDETYEQAKRAIDASEELSDPAKEFINTLLKNFSAKKHLKGYQIEKVNKILLDYEDSKTDLKGFIGPNGYSGIHLGLVVNEEEAHLEYCEENEIIEYNGHKYVIHESD